MAQRGFFARDLKVRHRCQNKRSANKARSNRAVQRRRRRRKRTPFELLYSGQGYRSKRKRDETRAITVSWDDAGRCIPPDCIVFVSSSFSASHCSGIRSFSLRESLRES